MCLLFSPPRRRRCSGKSLRRRQLEVIILTRGRGRKGGSMLVYHPLVAIQTRRCRWDNVVCDIKHLTYSKAVKQVRLLPLFLVGINAETSILVFPCKESWPLGLHIYPTASINPPLAVSSWARPSAAGVYSSIPTHPGEGFCCLSMTPADRHIRLQMPGSAANVWVCNPFAIPNSIHCHQFKPLFFSHYYHIYFWFLFSPTDPL